MKNFDFAPNVVRTSYRSSFFGDNYGSEFCFGPSFFICWWIFRILSCKRCILFNKNAPLWIELSVSLWGYLFPWYFLVEITILFHGWFGPGFHAGLSTSLFAPSLPVGFLETVDLLPAYVQFCRRVPGCDFGLCRFFWRPIRRILLFSLFMLMVSRLNAKWQLIGNK